MDRLILKARSFGPTNFIGLRHNAIFLDQRAFDETKLFVFKMRYGLVDLPWWLRPDDCPITDTSRLLERG